jgi:hypothetical protein
VGQECCSWPRPAGWPTCASFKNCFATGNGLSFGHRAVSRAQERSMSAMLLGRASVEKSFDDHQ